MKITITVIISAILFQFNSTQQSNFLDWWLIEEERLSPLSFLLKEEKLWLAQPATRSTNQLIHSQTKVYSFILWFAALGPFRWPASPPFGSIAFFRHAGLAFLRFLFNPAHQTNSLSSSITPFPLFGGLVCLRLLLFRGALAVPPPITAQATQTANPTQHSLAPLKRKDFHSFL